MSDLSEKLETPRGTPGTAQASAENLLRRWGSERVSEDEIRITYTGHSETWIRALGKGLAATFQRVPEGEHAAPTDSEA